MFGYGIEQFIDEVEQLLMRLANGLRVSAEYLGTT